MAKYKELMEASYHCGLCHKNNGSGPVDAGLDNGDERKQARKYLERAILKGNISTQYADKISSECDKCHDDGFESKSISLGLKKYI